MLVILSGVSGAGKDTIKKELMARMPNIVTLPSFKNLTNPLSLTVAISSLFDLKETLLSSASSGRTV